MNASLSLHMSDSKDGRKGTFWLKEVCDSHSNHSRNLSTSGSNRAKVVFNWTYSLVRFSSDFCDHVFG